MKPLATNKRPGREQSFRSAAWMAVQDWVLPVRIRARMTAAADT